MTGAPASLAEALRTGDPAVLPSRRDEAWRWSDLRGLLRVIPEASPLGDPTRLAAGPFAEIGGDELLVLNGRPIGRAAEIMVEAGAARTLALRLVSQAQGTGHHGAVSIRVGEGGALTLLESYEGQGAGYVADMALDIRLARGARLERIVIVDEAADAVSISQAQVALSPKAAFAQTVLTSGAKRQRHETRVLNPGGGAEARLDGVYLLEAGHADLTTVVVHQGVDGATRQLTKGAVRGASRAVFQGRIEVARGADRTDARMGHHALILSERAEVDAKPELEIYADDVACSHGNTVGALDEDALFYAQARGIPEAEAKAMLTAAFVAEVVDRIEHEAAREAARAWVAARLEAAA